ncbi:MAG: nickel-dependent lactate racemase [Janthinobacterium lividum]
MKIHLDYGKSGLDVELPTENVVGLLELTPAVPLNDPAQNIRQSLADPIGTRPLAELARGRKSACLVICDITRPVPNWVVLPPILDTLEACGILAAQITILIATGTHRPNFGTELTAILGDEIMARGCNVVNHFCDDPATNRSLGTTANNIAVALDTHYLDAELKITCGFIEPHFMAGYSGGRKMIMPGIASLKTIQAWHSPRFLEHPNATNGITRGNPVHEENTLIAGMAPPDMMVDVVLDTERRITGVFAGEMVQAWETGVAFVEKHVRAAVPAPVDIVVTTSAGWPLDLTYYQTIKGMVGALPIVKPGGHIIIASACMEGIGGADFTNLLLQTDNLETLMIAMQQPDWQPVPDQWQIEELAKAVRRNRVVCVTDGIPDETMTKLFASPAASVESAVAAALAVHGKDAKIAVIPKGPYVIPYISQAG